MSGIHDGHRGRMKEKFINYGLESFTDIEAIELLLFYSIPRKDTNELAHALLDRFRGFKGVMEAGVNELMEVEGIGENAASLIALVAAMNKRYLNHDRKNVKGTILADSESAVKYILPLFAYDRNERMIMVTLDAAAKVISCNAVGEGVSNMVETSTRKMMDIALRDNAVSIIIAHNHLSGSPEPSQADLLSTSKLNNAMKMIGVELLDHIIVMGNEYFSMRSGGMFSHLF